MPEPLALQIHRRVVAGETCEKIAEDLGIPVERIRARLKAAVRHTERRNLDDKLDIPESTGRGDDDPSQ